ncbi:MAG TPA: chitosanase [Polyangiaceae bacterium]|nr:chitosanase [Polyangiaceae bacterium]
MMHFSKWIHGVASLGVVVVLVATWAQGCGSETTSGGPGAGASSGASNSGTNLPTSGATAGSVGASGGSSGGASTAGSPSGSSGAGAAGHSSGAASGGPSGSPSSGVGTSSGASSGSSGGSHDAGIPSCPYTTDAAFCACLGNYNCGGATIKDSAGIYQAAFCGACTGGQCCVQGGAGPGIGTCGGNSPLVYGWQRDKINMLVSIGEHNNTVLNYSDATNINDGRGYSIGQVGFTTGTGDFILVAACFNDRKPGNILSKYWGHRDAKGKALDGLIYYSDTYWATFTNQGATDLIDKFGDFPGDVAAAAGETDGIFRKCQDDVGDALYLSQALKHTNQKHATGALTVGFLYDTELNFGENDDPSGLAGAGTVVRKADADYGPGLPTDFTGKPWEESRWLNFIILERVIEMSKDQMTWAQALDQNAAWEGARRLHTGPSNNPESATDLGMAYDIINKYFAGDQSAGVACWRKPPLASNAQSNNKIFLVGLDKSASATDQSLWKATGTEVGGAFAPCPTNPTP